MRSKNLSATVRRRLLETIRLQSRLIGMGFFRRDTAPELFDLAMAAKERRGRSMTFEGIRFPLKHGWHVYVCDPETGETLAAAGGIW